MRVGVVIVNWNSGELLARCLRSVAGQTRQPDRVVVVDNGSIGVSVDPCPGSVAETEVLLMDRNAGFAAATNAGVRHLSDCSWIAMLNPDAFPEPHWLEAMLAAAQKHDDCSMFASCQLMDADPRFLDGAGDAYHVSGAHWRRGYGGSANSAPGAGEVFAPCAAAALVRREAIEEVGGMDEDFFCYAEDMDLAFRLRLKGHKCLYVPDAVVRHVGSAVTGHGSDFIVYHGHRNLVWVYFKNMPWPLFWLYLPQHLLFNLISIAWFASRGRARAILKAKWDALLGLRRVLRGRRQVQKSRRVSAAEIRRAMARGLFAPYLRYVRGQASKQGCALGVADKDQK